MSDARLFLPKRADLSSASLSNTRDRWHVESNTSNPRRLTDGRGRVVEDTIEIHEDDDALVIEIPGREIWPLFRERAFGAANLLLWGALIAFMIAVSIGFSWANTALAVGGFFLFEAIVVGVAYYEQVRPLAAEAALRLDDDSATFVLNGDVEAVYPLDDVQMLQASPLSKLRKDDDEVQKLLPGPERYELTLLTAEDMHVVGRGLDETEADRAAEAVDEFLAEQERHA